VQSRHHAQERRELFIAAMFKCGVKSAKPAAWTPQARDRETRMSNDPRPHLNEP
jgi:hypothetical protein